MTAYSCSSSLLLPTGDEIRSLGHVPTRLILTGLDNMTRLNAFYTDMSLCDTIQLIDKTESFSQQKTGNQL